MMSDKSADTNKLQKEKSEMVKQLSHERLVLCNGFLNCFYDRNVDYKKANEKKFACVCTSAARSYHFTNTADGYNIAYFCVFVLLSLRNKDEFKKELKGMGQSFLRDLMSFTDAPKKYSCTNKKKRELLLNWYKNKLNLN